MKFPGYTSVPHFYLECPFVLALLNFDDPVSSFSSPQGSACKESDVEGGLFWVRVGHLLLPPLHISLRTLAPSCYWGKQSPSVSAAFLTLVLCLFRSLWVGSSSRSSFPLLPAHSQGHAVLDGLSCLFLLTGILGSCRILPQASR